MYILHISIGKLRLMAFSMSARHLDRQYAIVWDRLTLLWRNILWSQVNHQPGKAIEAPEFARLNDADEVTDTTISDEDLEESVEQDEGTWSAGLSMADTCQWCYHQ